MKGSYKKPMNKGYGKSKAPKAPKSSKSSKISTAVDKVGQRKSYRMTGKA